MATKKLIARAERRSVPYPTRYLPSLRSHAPPPFPPRAPLPVAGVGRGSSPPVFAGDGKSSPARPLRPPQYVPVPSVSRQTGQSPLSVSHFIRLVLVGAGAGATVCIVLVMLLLPLFAVQPSPFSVSTASRPLPDVPPQTQDSASVENRLAGSAPPSLAPLHAPPAPPRQQHADELPPRLPKGQLVRPREEGTERRDPTARRRSRTEAKEPADTAETRFVHPEDGYTLTPPPGFILTQRGRRTVWSGPHGAQLLVETTSSPGRSARGGWEELHTVELIQILV